MSKSPQVPHPMSQPGSRNADRPADAPASSWVEQMPALLRHYLRLMRLDRPVGIWLLYWPCVFGLLLGAVADGRSLPNAASVILMGAGALVMRGAGCTFNDIIDRKYDAQVARTRGRPIPSGAVSVTAAIVFAAGLSLAGLAILLTC